MSYDQLDTGFEKSFFMNSSSNPHYWGYPKFEEKQILWEKFWILDRTSDIYHPLTKQKKIFHDFFTKSPLLRVSKIRGKTNFMEKYLNFGSIFRYISSSNKTKKNIFLDFFTKSQWLRVLKISEKLNFQWKIKILSSKSRYLELISPTKIQKFL